MAFKFQRYGSTFEFNVTGIHAVAMFAVAIIAGVAIGYAL